MASFNVAFVAELSLFGASFSFSSVSSFVEEAEEEVVFVAFALAFADPFFEFSNVFEISVGFFAFF